MKVNAPEKIYIQSFNVSEEDAKFDKSKMFFDDVWTEEPELERKNIEYTRTDAFIEKACEYLKEIFSEYENLTDYNPTNDFKNYMKGE